MNPKALLLLALLGIAATPAAASEATIKPLKCPFGGGSVPKTYIADCSEMTWFDEGIEFRSWVARFTPKDRKRDFAPVIYIPGGPGDAPVSAEGDVSNILALFPRRELITFNPRGVKNSAPRPICEFDPEFWEEDIPREREFAMVAKCRADVTALHVPMHLLDAPYLARDVSQLVAAMDLPKAGVFGVSYGTESVLHLLDQGPRWLDFAILDSVSLPGVLGVTDRLAARDRFLGTIDRLCFEKKECPRSVTDAYPTLMDWTKQFDADPVKIEIGPHKKDWSLDALEMLDFLASMTSYPDGAGYGPVFIEAFEDNRRDSEKWIASEIDATFDYALDNFALLYQAYSDSDERTQPAPSAGSTKYPFDHEEYQDFAKLFRIWNTDDRTEPKLITAQSKRSRPNIPVLVVSGGNDTLTPLEWADLLHRRFAGLTHFVFPGLAHAVAFGTDADVTNPEIAQQLRCGPEVVRAFASEKGYGKCSRFLRK